MSNALKNKEIKGFSTNTEHKNELLNTILTMQNDFLKQGMSYGWCENTLQKLLKLTNSEFGFIHELLTQADGTPYLKSHITTNIAWDDESRQYYEKNKHTGLNFFNFDSIWGQVMKTGKAYISEDPDTNPHRGGYPKEEGHPALKSFLGIPIKGDNNELIGMMAVANNPNGYNQQMVDFIEPFASTYGVLLEKMRLEKKHKLDESRSLLKQEVLEKLANNDSLINILNFVVDIVEQNKEGMFCSILLLDDAGKHLTHGSAPSLPAFYNEALDGIEIGDGVRSCGTAAFTKKTVIVEDIQSHPYWSDFKELALKAKLLSCWSVPIMNKTGKVFGTFAIYHDRITKPTEDDLLSISNLANFLTIAIEKKRNDDKLFKQKSDLIKAKEKAEESEKALKHSHDLMKYIIEHNRSAVAVHDKDFKYIYVSQRYLQEYKVKELDIIGKHHYDVFPDLPQKWRDVHKKALLGEVSSANDDPYYKDDGTVEWTRWECRPWYETDDTIGGFIVYTEVITERKNMELALSGAKEKAEESEKKYKKALLQANQFVEILDNLPSYIYMKNKKYQYTYANKICLNLFNKTKENIYGSVDEEFFPAETIKQLREIDKKILGTGLSTNEEIPVRSDDGSYVYYLEMKFPLYNEHGKINGICGISTDITEIKKIEVYLIAAKEKAEESDRLKSAFVANMSHEIRTPMNGILGFADLLEDADTSQKEREKYTAIIKSSGERLLELMNNLIDFSKVEAGQMMISKTNVDIAVIFERLDGIFHSEIIQKKIELTFHNQSLQRLVFTDSNFLESVLINLIKNAIKFTKEGFVKVNCKKDNGGLIFCVQDTGIGIHKDNIDSIFERFSQEDISLTKNYEGAGLGLSISKSYIELLGGKIWADSEVGKGSTFYFTIPLQENN